MSTVTPGMLARGPMSTVEGASNMHYMTTAAANRLVLIGPARGPRGRDSATIRRYRIARLRLEGQQRPGKPAHAHLKRLYD